ncbi:MAG: ACT domain-containing protein [Planctomycetota bacterium]|jgi:hypothetical protein
MDYLKLKLSLLPQTYAICSFSPDFAFSVMDDVSSILSITKTSKETTIVCDENRIPGDCRKSGNWKCIKVEGSFDLDAIGVIAGISRPLAESRISIYVVSTYETDYVLIKAKDIDKAVACLSKCGHKFTESKETP